MTYKTLAALILAFIVVAAVINSVDEMLAEATK